LDLGAFAGDDGREELDEVTMSSNVGIEEVLISQRDDLRRRICNVVAALDRSFSTILIKSFCWRIQILIGMSYDGPYRSFYQSWQVGLKIHARLKVLVQPSVIVLSKYDEVVLHLHGIGRLSYNPRD
jgi:hypothetical protein